MNYFVGIVPPEDIYRQILNIQRQFGDNRLEPHITLRPPVSPSNEGGWINTIMKAASAFKPFHIDLTGTGYFGKRVLFISMRSEPLIKLYDLLIPSLKEFEPKEANKGPEKFHPHLTLGRAWCGFSPEDFKKMQHLTKEYLATGNISFEVRYIRIYHKPDHHGRYQPYKDVPLSE